jgi:hypothetical protein
MFFMSAEEAKTPERRALETNAGLLAAKTLEQIEVPAEKEAKLALASTSGHEDANPETGSVEEILREDEGVAPVRGKGVYTWTTGTTIGAYTAWMGLVSTLALPLIGKALLAVGYPVLTGAALLGIWAGVFLAPVALYYITLAILALTTKSERVKKIVEGSKRAGNKSNRAAEIKRNSNKK